jgi:hypothetical protein
MTAPESASDVNMHVVGLRVRLTMTKATGGDPCPTAAAVPATIEGTVYSLNPTAGMLVLMTQAGNERSSFRIIRLAFIEDIELVTNPDTKCKVGIATPEQALPAGVAQYATLPSLQTDGGDPLERKLNQKKRQGEEGRKYNGVDDDISIRALEVLDQLARVYPDARWDEDKNCILVGKDIAVKGQPSWNKPKVKGTADQSEVVARIQRTLDKK